VLKPARKLLVSPKKGELKIPGLPEEVHQEVVHQEEVRPERLREIPQVAAAAETIDKNKISRKDIPRLITT